MSQLCHSASLKQNKANTGGGQFKTEQSRLHKELKISSCCDVESPIWHFKAYLLQLPDKKMFDSCG